MIPDTIVETSVKNDPMWAQHGRVYPTIGFLTFGIDSLITSNMWDGICDIARERGASALCFPGGWVQGEGYGMILNKEANILYALARPDAIDGLVIWGATILECLEPGNCARFYEQFAPLPMVNIGNPLPGIPNLVADNAWGIRQLLQHLLDEHGYRRCAFIRGPEGNVDADERYAAYRTVLEEHHIPFDPALVVTGDNQPRSGAVAVQQLFDNQHTPVDVIVASNDNMALGTLEALQARGLRVPEDVAVAGFDDIEQAEVASVPLTTVNFSFYQLGRRAATMLLDQLAGQTIPEQTTLPLNIVVRQSCGCQSAGIAQAAVDVSPHTAEPEGSLAAISDSRRRNIVADISAILAEARIIMPDLYAAQALDAFIEEMLGRSGIFLSTLATILDDIIAAGQTVSIWQNVISVVRRQLFPHLTDETRTQAENLWGQARVCIGEAKDRSQAIKQLQQQHRMHVSDEIGQQLITTFDLDQLADVLARNLPRLGIPSAYFTLYESPKPYAYPQDAPPWSRLMLAYDEHERARIPPGGRRFPTAQLISPDVAPPRQFNGMILPLYFQQEQIGLAVLESGPRDSAVYDRLRTQISSALQGALLVGRVQEKANELATAYEEIRILNKQLREENVRMGAELNVARHMQQMILPRPEELARIEELDIVGYMQPADEVGGDYYDVLLNHGVLHIGIGDVTGHGLESGILMLMTQTAIRTLVEHGETDPRTFLTTLNRIIYQNAHRMRTDKTLTCALIQYHQGHLKIVGQHEDLLIVRQNGQVECLNTIDLGFPLGLENNIDQWVASGLVLLEPGDGVVLYTDGVTEAENLNHKQYGIDRLCDVVSRHWTQSAEAVKEAILEDLMRHIGRQRIYDDITLVVLKQRDRCATLCQHQTSS